jgi:hypothetical protein
MAAAVQIAPHENDMVVQMRGFAQRMIRALAVTGSSAASPDVLAYQQAWNANGPIISSLLKKLGSSRRWVKLVEDGKYGPNTSSALCTIICGAAGISVPPSKASAMPVWAAQNKDGIDALTPPSAAPVTSVLNEPLPIPGDGSDAADAQAVINSSGSVIRNTVPVNTPTGTPVGPPQVISTTMSTVPGGIAAPVADVLNAPDPSTPIQHLTDQELAPLETQTDFTGEDIHVVGTRVASRVPLLAVGLGVVGLGGTIVWWINRGKRRRR